MPYIIAADQGTTSSRAILFDENQHIVAIAQRELTQYYPRQGWVEHDPMEIYSSQMGVISEVVAKSGVQVSDIAAIGITNQRETAVVWDRETGKPIHNAIVWQCRRTAGICEDLKKRDLQPIVWQKTGLIIDAYFSGTKYAWILDHVEGARERAEKGELMCGTVDSWLIYRMTNGSVHVTDYTNASRTMLFNLHTLEWDADLCRELAVPIQMLPDVVSSSEKVGIYNISGHEVPIAGIAGDQQAALFGQTCFERGEGKNTYGTGNFLLVHTGGEICQSQNGLITTIAAGGRQQVSYALEGSVFVGGAVIQWLRDEMGLINEAMDSEYFASKVNDTNGVYVVPAFTGLGAPWWDMYARGTIVGITRGTSRNHLIRAALESVAYQSHAVIRAMESDLNQRMSELRVDGGASANNLLMQFQADITEIAVVRPCILETTALGAAYLAGLAVGLWKSCQEIQNMRSIDRVFTPSMDQEKRKSLLDGFEKAVSRSRDWSAD